MDFTQALIMSIVEGLTEFLPISSTFHLIFTAKILGIVQTDFVKFFEVFIQLGAILAVFFISWHDVLHNHKLMMRVLLSFLPIAMIGLLVYSKIKSLFDSHAVLVWVFLIFGMIFVAYELLFKTQSDRNLNEISPLEAMIVGLAQAIALVPGVSRAGMVIVMLMILGYGRSDAARYSFLLALPTMLAASAYDFTRNLGVLTFSQEEILILLVGFAGAFLSAWLSVRWLITFLKQHNLIIFGIYRVILILIILSLGLL